MATARSNIRVDVTADTTQFVREMRRADQTATGFNRTMQGAARGIASIDGPLGGISGRLNAVNSLLSSGALGWAAFGAAVAGATVIMYKSISANAEAERQMLKLDAIIQGTGESAGRTAEQLDEQARAVALSTLASTEGVRDAQAILLTFTSVVRSNFDRTISISQDLAEVMRTNITSAAKQLGKALEDPRQGLSSLTKAGVTFEAGLKSQIIAMSESGRTFEAQSLILDRIRGQIGEPGVAAAGGLIGAVDTLGQRWQEFLQRLEETSGSGSLATRALVSLGNAIKNFQDIIAPGEQDIYTKLFGKREKLVEAIELSKRLEATITDDSFRKETEEVRKGNEEKLRIIESTLKEMQSVREKADREGAAAELKSIELEKQRDAQKRATFLNAIAEEAAAAAEASDKKVSAEIGRADKLRLNAAKTVEKLRVFLGDEETAIKSSYTQRSKDLEAAFKVDEELRERYGHLTEEILIKRDKDLAEVDKKRKTEKLESTSELFENIASITENGNRDLQAIGRAAAVTQATIDGVLAVQKALASAPPPLNYALAATVGIMAAQNVAKIAGIAHNGMTNIPKEGTYMLDKGERVLSPAQNKDLGSFMNQGGGSGVVVNINNYSGQEATQTQDGDQINIVIGAVKQSISNDVNRGVGLADTFQKTYGLTRAGVV